MQQTITSATPWSRIAILIACLLTASCRLSIDVPENGSVYTQSGELLCAAGKQCVFDVEDLDFDQTFIAVGQGGFQFTGWHQEQGYICGGNQTPCRLFTSWFNFIEGGPELFSNGETTLYLRPEFSFLDTDVASVLRNPDLSDTDFTEPELLTFDDQACQLEVDNSFFFRSQFELPPLVLRDDVGGQPAHALPLLWDNNGDGVDDLFIWGAYLQSGGPKLQTPAKGVLVYLESSENGMQDRTVAKFGSRNVDYFGRKAEAEDINGDGLLDLLVATNNEDGRTADDTDDIGTPLTLYMSNASGSYERIEVGYAAWNHSASMGDIDNDGVLEIIQGAYHTHSKYGQKGNWWWSPSHILDYKRGSWTDKASSLRDRDIFNANEHVLADFDEDGCEDMFANARAPQRSDAIIYKGHCDGTFSRTQYFPVPVEQFRVPGIAWNSDETEFAIAEIDGDWVASLALYWSTKIDVDADGDTDILYALSGFKVDPSDRANNFANQNKGTPHLVAYLLKNNGGEFARYALPLGPEAASINFLYAQTPDLNQDGFPDLVADDWQVPMSKSIFINDGRGRFHQLDLENVSALNGKNKPIPIDFDGDGIAEFLTLSSWELFETSGLLPSCITP